MRRRTGSRERGGRAADIPAALVASSRLKGTAARQAFLPRLRVAVAASGVALGERCGVRRLASTLCGW